MKTCPGCSFLMGDDEAMCAACASTRRTFPLDDPAVATSAYGSGSVGGAAGGATLLLERPAFTPHGGPAMQFRDPARGRNLRQALILVVVLAALGGLGYLGLNGEGPLASTAVKLGLAEPPAVAVPKQWSTTNSAEGKFSVELPLGAEPLAEEDGSPIESAVGQMVDIGREADMYVLRIETGLNGEQLRTMDDAGFNALVDAFVAGGRFGTETVRREALLGNGRAIDSVIVEGDSLTARVRFFLSGAGLHVLATAGPDAKTRDLDQAHLRMIDSFSPQP